MNRWANVGRANGTREMSDGGACLPNADTWETRMNTITKSPADLEALKQQALRLARMAREEDLGQRGDITSALAMPGPTLSTQDSELRTPASVLTDASVVAPSTFRLLAKQPGVFAGREIAAEVLSVFDNHVRLRWAEAGRDGARIEKPPLHLATLTGPAGVILAAERTLLNFLQRLSGIATATRHYVDAVEGTRARIMDTRKTTPGWRVLEKYAVRCGGGYNHRMGLYDAILIKDNHLAGIPPERLAQAVFEMLNRAEALSPRPAFVEVEADTLAQVERLLTVVGINVILLDNFRIEDIRAAVRLRDDLNLRGQVEFEVSGGVRLDTVRAIAETSVERISVGAITHSATALDLSLERAG